MNNTALPSLGINNLILVNQGPPGRPEETRERIAVPGDPRAEGNRPSVAPGRIPVGAPAQSADLELGEDEAALLERIDKLKEQSSTYQIVKLLLASKGDEQDAEAVAPPGPREGATTSLSPATVTRPIPTGAEQSAGTVANINIRVETLNVNQQSVSVENGGGQTRVEVNSLTYQRVSISFQQPAPEPAPPPQQRSDPIALDLDGDGLETTGVENGVRFDIDGNGTLDQTSFVTGGDAFLALDRNGNGGIDDGSELFGDQLGDANGFANLARYDGNGDQRIDVGDAIYDDLRLLTIDANGNQRLIGLAEAGIRSLDLSYQNTDIDLNGGDKLAQIATFERVDGSTGTTGDLLLGFRGVA